MALTPLYLLMIGLVITGVLGLLWPRDRGRRIGDGTVPPDIERPRTSTRSPFGRRPSTDATTEPPRRLPRIFTALPFLFLGIWLVGWTTGIFWAANEFLNTEETDGRWVLAVWLAFAAAAWVFIARMMLQLAWAFITGRDIPMRKSDSAEDGNPLSDSSNRGDGPGGDR